MATGSIDSEQPYHHIIEYLFSVLIHAHSELNWLLFQLNFKTFVACDFRKDTQV